MKRVFEVKTNKFQVISRIYHTDMRILPKEYTNIVAFEDKSCYYAPSFNQLDAYKVLVHKSEINHVHLIMLKL